MELTFIGIAQIIIGGLLVVAGRLRHLLIFLLVSILFGGSASALLPALGGSSIPPVHFALLFIYLRLLMPGGRTIGQLPDAFRANRWFALFAIYGAMSAFIMPRLFNGDFEVAPMKPISGGGLFATTALEPTSQNITTAVYLVGALLAVLAVWICCRRQEMGKTLVSGLITITWLHALLGLGALAARGTPVETFLELFRNSNYDQLDAEAGGFVRIRGIYPEASSYAALGVALFVSMSELWFRSIRSRAAGQAALVIGVVLFFSTSSTAYVGLGCYGIFFLIRFVAFPGVAARGKGLVALSVVASSLVLTAFAFLAMPELVHSVFDVVQQMTISKSTSDSGAQRLFWTLQGWDLFLATYGLGAGAGSFRSSSIFFAILGSMGVVGIISFIVYFVAVFQPWRKSSWGVSPIGRENLGAAFGSAALLSLVPGATNGASPLPDTILLVLAAASIALRPMDLARKKSEAVRPTGREQDLAKKVLKEIRTERYADR